MFIGVWFGGVVVVWWWCGGVVVWCWLGCLRIVDWFAIDPLALVDDI
jgi:hypothetical protein